MNPRSRRHFWLTLCLALSLWSPLTFAAPGDPETGVDLEALAKQTPEGLQKEIADRVATAPLDKDGLPIIEWTESDGLKIITVAQAAKLKEWVNRILLRLQVPGDAKHFKIVLEPLFTRNAYASLDQNPPILGINLGLLLDAKSEDEIAGVIAHELTHTNKEQFSNRQAESRVDQIIRQIESTAGLKIAHYREEIRADVGAVDRLVKAGYNPWEYYESHKRMASDEDKRPRYFDEAAMSTHPPDEVRMTTIKAVMLEHFNTTEVGANIEKKTPLPPFIGKLKTTAIAITQAHSLLRGGRAVKDSFKEMGSLLAEDIKQIFLSSMTKKGLLIYAAVLGGFAAAATVGPELAHAVSEFLKAHFDQQSWEAFVSLLKENGVILGGAGTVATYVGFANYESRYKLSAYEKSFKETNSLEDLIKLVIRYQQVFRSFKGTILLKKKYQSHVKELGERLLKIEDFQSLSHYEHRALEGLIGSDASEIRAILDPWFDKHHALIRTPQEYLDRAKSIDAAMDKSFDELVKYEAKLQQIEDRKKLGPQTQGDVHAEPIIRKKMSALRRLRDTLTKESIESFGLRYAREQWDQNPPPGLSMQMRLDLMEQRGKSSVAFGEFPHANGEKFIEIMKAALALPKGERRDSILKGLEGTVGYGFSSSTKNPVLAGILDLSEEKLPIAWVGLELVKDIIINGGPHEELPFIKPKTLFGRLNSKLKKSIAERNIQSVTQLHEYLDKEFLPLTGEGSYLSQAVNDLVTQNPQWVRDNKDIEILLKNGLYWRPTGTSPKSNPEWVERFEELAKFWGKNKGAVYIPGKSEPLHRAIVDSLKAKGTYPQDFESNYRLWERLASRGLTTPVQDLFEDMRTMATPEQRARLDAKAIKEDWIWNARTKALIVAEDLYRSPEWRRLKAAPRSDRSKELQDVVARVEKEFPKRGLEYQNLLESISTELQTSEKESAFITSHRTLKPGEWTEDAVLRAYSGMLIEALQWKPKKQWDLVLFLRGQPVTKEIADHFEDFGHERVVREFQELTPEIKAAMLDSFLSSPKGLLKTVDFKAKYPGKILEHLMGETSGASRDMATELLEGFLYSLKATGNEPLQSSVLAFLLARPLNDGKQSTAETLKAVLEAYGATGVKIGQLLTTAGVLSEEDSRVLSQLQDRAKVPLREEIYADLRKIYGGDQPYEVLEVLGAASMKVAVKAIDQRTGKTVVLKILREQAVAHTPLEFKQLRAMVDFLVKRHGKKYSILKTIVRAAEEGVKQELSFSKEIERSRIAREKLYAQMSDEFQIVGAPDEYLEKPRLIVAEFAPGDSIKNLPPEDQDRVARKIVEMETKILTSKEDVIYFDADRHPGNTRAQGKADVPAGQKPRVSPIDFGVLTSITAKDRDRVIRLFALAQILKETGSTEWAAQEVIRIMDLPANKKLALMKALRDHFPARSTKEITAYFGVLTSLESSGVEAPTSYIEFVRAILQHPQYDKWMIGPESARPQDTLVKFFESNVKKQALEMLSRHKLKPVEKARIAAQLFKDVVIGEPGNRPCSLAEVLVRVRKVQSQLQQAAP